MAPAAAADPLLLLLGVLDALPPDADLAVVRDDARWVVGEWWETELKVARLLAAAGTRRLVGAR